MPQDGGSCLAFFKKYLLELSLRPVRAILSDPQILSAKLGHCMKNSHLGCPMALKGFQFGLGEMMIMVVLVAALAAVSAIPDFWPHSFFAVLLLALVFAPLCSLIALLLAIFSRDHRRAYLQNAGIGLLCFASSALALGTVLGW